MRSFSTPRLKLRESSATFSAAPAAELAIDFLRLTKIKTNRLRQRRAPPQQQRAASGASAAPALQFIPLRPIRVGTAAQRPKSKRIPARYSRPKLSKNV